MKRLTLIAGPCLVEDYDTCAKVADTMMTLCDRLKVDYIFKASYKKANRTKGDSCRTIGEGKALDVLRRVKEEFNVKITTDVHEVKDVSLVKNLVDVIQIPAFLCRQTELIETAAATDLVVNIKKGQFASATTMKYAAEKVMATGNDSVWLTERGNTFGYENLVVDILNIPRMRPFAKMVVMDCTHATQRTNQTAGISGGSAAEAYSLMRSAVAVGADGLFVETHPDPTQALSDSGSMISLAEMPGFVKDAYELYTFVNE